VHLGGSGGTAPRERLGLAASPTGFLVDTANTAQAEGLSSSLQAAMLELRDVSKQYPGQREPAIANLSFSVGAGEVRVLVGPSGSRKTTALRLINRMIPLSEGDILLGGEGVLGASRTTCASTSAT
jgi:ABC-type multidrug transport system fused ATPase/permease subunit